MTTLEPLYVARPWRTIYLVVLAIAGGYYLGPGGFWIVVLASLDLRVKLR